MEQPIEIFCCYAREDQQFLSTLRAHFASLQRQGLIRIWTDTDITAGQEREEEIKKYLKRAKIILLLVSSDFIASDSNELQNELQQAMKQHELGEAYVIPLILRPVDWQGMPFSKLQPLPKDGKPIEKWANREDALLEVVQGIRAVIDEIKAEVSPSESEGLLPIGKTLTRPEVDQELALVQRMTPQLEIAFTKGDWLDVIRKANFLIRRVPWLVTSTVYRLQGLALFKKGKIEWAQEALNTALALTSDSEQRFTLLDDYITIFISQEKWNEAQRYIQEALQLTTHDPIWRLKQTRYNLLTLVQRQLAILEALHMTDQTQVIELLKKRVLMDSYRILVIGDYLRGKRTFINALLGQEVLPLGTITGITSIVKWGETPRAVLYPHRSLENSSTQPEEIPIDDIEKYFLDERLRGRLELFLSLDFCRNDIELINIPSFIYESQEDIFAYLPTSDAMVFAFSVQGHMGRSERQIIDRIRNIGYKDIFFVCNQFNEVRLADRERLKEYFQRLLSPLTERGTRSIFFIDALLALEGRLSGNQEKLNQSGILLVEKELKSFLAAEVRRKKFPQFADTLMHTLLEAQSIVGSANSGLTDVVNELSIIKNDLETFIRRETEPYQTNEAL